MVECDLAKVEVAGSTPVSRSKILMHLPSLAARVLLFEWRGTQVVRERSAKPLCVGSIPTRASISNPYKIVGVTTSTLSSLKSPRL